MNKYKIIFTISFTQMLKKTLKHWKSYSTTYATKIESKIHNAISILKLFPYATPSIKIKNKSDNYRKLIINKRFLIIFKIVNYTVYLLYFIDGKLNSKNYFKD